MIITLVLAIGLVLTVLLVVYQNIELKDDDTISVVGSYSTKVAPDQFEITLRVITEGNTASEAQNNNKNNANKLILALKNSGLEDKDIQTASYYTNKKTVCENGRYLEKGYETVNSIMIQTKNLDNAGNLIDISAQYGANGADSLAFTLSEEKREQTYQEALSKVGDNAKSRAEALAKSIGFKVIGVKSISLNEPRSPPYYYLDMAETKAVSDTPIQPRDVDVEVTATVVFEIQ